MTDTANLFLSCVTLLASGFGKKKVSGSPTNTVCSTGNSPIAFIAVCTKFLWDSFPCRKSTDVTNISWIAQNILAAICCKMPITYISSSISLLGFFSERIQLFSLSKLELNRCSAGCLLVKAFFCIQGKTLSSFQDLKVNATVICGMSFYYTLMTLISTSNQVNTCRSGNSYIGKKVTCLGISEWLPAES